MGLEDVREALVILAKQQLAVVLNRSFEKLVHVPLLKAILIGKFHFGAFCAQAFHSAAPKFRFLQGGSKGRRSGKNKSFIQLKYFSLKMQKHKRAWLTG